MRIGIFLATMIMVQLSIFCAAQSAPNHEQEITSHSLRAQEFLQAKKPDLAMPELEAVIALDPSNVNAQANLGVLLYFRGDYAKAEPHLRVAVNLQAGLEKIQGLLGIAEKRIGQTANARLNLEAAFPAIKDREFKIQAGMELIELYTASGDLELAAHTIGALQRVAPDNLEIQYVAYRIYSDLASGAMLTLSILGPESAQMHQVMAREASRQGDTIGSIAQERAAIKIDPNLPGVHLELGELLSATGDSKSDAEAEQEYLDALKENRFDERAECGLGRLLARQGKLDGALQYYSAAVALQVDDFEANSGMAQTLIQMNQESKALPFLEKAVKLEPTDAADHYRLSRLYRQQNRLGDAKHEMALYLKYKSLKQKLGTIYKNLRLSGPQSETIAN